MQTSGRLGTAHRMAHDLDEIVEYPARHGVIFAVWFALIDRSSRDGSCRLRQLGYLYTPVVAIASIRRPSSDTIEILPDGMPQGTMRN
jgi:hypothetical protein